MNRLSALDALFLYVETPQTPMHVGSVAIFKPAPQDVDLYAAFRKHTADRLELLPSYLRRLAPTPLSLDHPAWIIRGDIDLDHHVRHVALPKPGSLAQLRELVARLHEIPLDRARPLWEYYLIEGLQDGAFAVYIKLHHAAMDGVAGISMLPFIYDFMPQGEPMPNRALAQVAPAPSDFLELTSTAIADFLRQGVRTVRALPSVVSVLAKAAPRLAQDARQVLTYLRGMPRTPFNVAISGERVYGVCSLPLREVKALAKARGATINDVVMTVCAGAIRRYLFERGALPDRALTAAVPASLRVNGDATMNNQVMFMLARLPTNIAAPLPRLAAARAASQEAKTLFTDVKDLLTTDFSIIGAPLFISGIARLMAATHVANVLPGSFNVVISNVPGPRTPMYCAGVEALHYYPISIPYHGCALNITVESYVDSLDFGFVACRRTVPDVQSLADYVVEDFRTLCEAQSALARPGAVATIEIARPRSLLTQEAKLESPAEEPRLTRVSTQGAEASAPAERASAKGASARIETNAEAATREKARKRPQAANPRPRRRAPAPETIAEPR